MTDLSHSASGMNWGRLIRQFHRWTSIVFTLSVIATFIALALPEPLVWVSYVPLLPLFLLLFSGLWMFFQPYIAKRRRGA